MALLTTYTKMKCRGPPKRHVVDNGTEGARSVIIRMHWIPRWDMMGVRQNFSVARSFVTYPLPLATTGLKKEIEIIYACILLFWRQFF